MGDSPEGLRLIKTEREKRGGGAPIGAKPPAYSDIGNAIRFARDHGNDVRYCAELAGSACGGWLVWEPTGKPTAAPGGNSDGPPVAMQTGGRWRPDLTGAVVRKAKLTIEKIRIENELYAGQLVEVEPQMAHYVASQTKGKVSAMLSLAESELPIPCTLADFDTNPLLLNVRNGTIDLMTGELFRRVVRT